MDFRRINLPNSKKDIDFSNIREPIMTSTIDLSQWIREVKFLGQCTRGWIFPAWMPCFQTLNKVMSLLFMFGRHDGHSSLQVLIKIIHNLFHLSCKLPSRIYERNKLGSKWQINCCLVPVLIRKVTTLKTRGKVIRREARYCETIQELASSEVSLG